VNNKVTISIENERDASLLRYNNANNGDERIK